MTSYTIHKLNFMRKDDSFETKIAMFEYFCEILLIEIFGTHCICIYIHSQFYYLLFLQRFLLCQKIVCNGLTALYTLQYRNKQEIRDFQSSKRNLYIRRKFNFVIVHDLFYIQMFLITTAKLYIRRRRV